MYGYDGTGSGYQSDYQSAYQGIGGGCTFMIPDQYFSPDDEGLQAERDHYKSQGNSVIRFKLSKHE